MHGWPAVSPVCELHAAPAASSLVLPSITNGNLDIFTIETTAML
jgi:hypothetical protein